MFADSIRMFDRREVQCTEVNIVQCGHRMPRVRNCTECVSFRTVRGFVLRNAVREVTGCLSVASTLDLAIAPRECRGLRSIVGKTYWAVPKQIPPFPALPRSAARDIARLGVA